MKLLCFLAAGLLSQLGRRESWADTVLSRTIPGELWGAANAVSAAVKRSYSLERDRGVTKASQVRRAAAARGITIKLPNIQPLPTL